MALSSIICLLLFFAAVLVFVQPFGDQSKEFVKDVRTTLIMDLEGVILDIETDYELTDDSLLKKGEDSPKRIQAAAAAMKDNARNLELCLTRAEQNAKCGLRVFLQLTKSDLPRQTQDSLRTLAERASDFRLQTIPKMTNIGTTAEEIVRLRQATLKELRQTRDTIRKQIQ
jgi:hypothetical protein